MNFKKLHDGEKPILICNVWNVESARIARVPCHRIIGKNENLTGYGGGIER